MHIFRQNRYVALLVGAILVCLGAIYLLGQNSEKESTKKREFSHYQNFLNADLAVKTVSFTQSGTVTQNEKQFLPFLTTLELKNRVIDTGIRSSEQLHELAEEVLWLRKQTPAPTIKESAPDKFNPPTQLFFTRTELLSHEDKEEATWTYALNEEELLLLQKIVMAEAEGEPYEGKVAVANVVLNRLRSANYPDTIKDVIYQKSQFSPVRNGRLKKVKPSKDTIHAVNEALNGRKEVSDDTYYFLSLKLAKDLTIARTKDKAHVIGNHTFYK
ncbi:N-acetylmuramoyl-L-alanine amidase [Fontibacillus phaseoli]|uniref:N-acetylmuramoyl-L-alanine amidase n=1 Tax=Fontibacillus phaseoli TaxID=1416533 RepID=A0A369BIY2_9BACL|nr:cell wall hydrolase [Fontibacillus phaseoli]RCX20536.1 N-acetylmuramoyl-L-alanine amidase [Fontibacillus phaseoli]